jgi:Flp pilus assembly pilin Flp
VNARLNCPLREVLADERGQVSAEYMLLVVIVVIAALGAFDLFSKGVVGYYQRITMVVSLPVP